MRWRTFRTDARAMKRLLLALLLAGCAGQVEGPITT